jgi:hypothetical protein
MPSALAPAAATESHPPPPAPAQAPASPALQLAQANRALWVATLSLMTAYMQTPAPAHRYLLARRIARNFDTLSRQDCFDAGCRASFSRLARRWQLRAEQVAPEGPRPGGALMRLFS